MFSNESQNHFQKESSKAFHKVVNKSVQNKNQNGLRQKSKFEQNQNSQNKVQKGIYKNFHKITKVFNKNHVLDIKNNIKLIFNEDQINHFQKRVNQNQHQLLQRKMFHLNLMVHDF